jgi:hypothetical protein
MTTCRETRAVVGRGGVGAAPDPTSSFPRPCSVVACAQIRAEFLRDDVKQDQDQLSILSGATMTRSDQMALDSEDDLDQSSEYGCVAHGPDRAR